MNGILYVTGTPIGNLEDITLRQLRILQEVDFIAAEDTRVTRKLLTHFEIKTELVSYHEHSDRNVIDGILNRIASGQNCAIVTDAGMPCISDPGENLVRACYERGIPVQAVPGASAVITALSVCGGSTKQFVFYGFLPVEKKQRSEMLRELQTESRTSVLYEAPHKLCRTLADLCETAGADRQIAICRELTKIHEEVLRFCLEDAMKYYETHVPRGEFVLVLDGAEKSKQDDAFTLADAVAIAESYLAQGMPAMTAAKSAAKQTGLSKNQIYQALHS
ncbi:MAG: 16S rRNA (cytidine(1402)-2'-O)-methyltransferase [Oscillospiraceae bacterium]|nr:16S rRNA (cytidine(1402)-2'-O)-methyltransferase [Oscillospiraceae bacterium]MDE5884672.1 16S rRNA (cytidine(1402)-2'-O)-methyltransferase [Oscillospiraceae bacterium]